MMHVADNHDALLDYLYEEGDPAERLKIAKHLQECAACSVAVLEFQNVRGMLRDWTPPIADLGFRIVRDAALSAPVSQGVRGGWSRGWGPATYQKMPWLAQAAAAVVLFAAGMAVSQLNIDYGGGALTVRTRSAAPSANIRNASITLPSQNVSAVSNTGAAMNIDELERALSERLQAQNASAVDTERLLQRVRAMIDQSEQRQQRELALRLSQVAREVDTQHQADLMRIQQDFGQQQEATMEYLVRTSGGAK
jgi:anti-sigma factor RsiW